MSIVVQKYGGSSVADVSRIRQVAERVMRTRRAGHDVVVVVSAMGDTTDDLIALAKQVSPNPERRELDMLLTAGERIAMALVSMAEETQELAESGARVLNAQAVEFAKAQGIAIYARATTSPLPGADPSADGTVVRRDPPRGPGTVVGVASERDILVLESSAPQDEVLALLDLHHAAGKQLHVVSGGGDGRLTLVLSRENLHEEARLRDALAARFGDRLHLADDLGAVSVVGAGINASFDNVRRGSAALVAAGIAPHGVATSSFRITWTVPRDRLDEAVRLLHRTYL
jgi:aspartate kinase